MVSYVFVRRVKNVVAGIILAVALFFFLFPIYWMVSTAFKVKAEFWSYPPIYIPTVLTLNNFLEGFELGGLESLKHSLIVASCNTVVCVILGSLAAYAIARYRIGGDNLAFWILSNRMLPPIAFVIPLFLWFRTLKLLDTYPALILAYCTFNLPFATWLLIGFFEEVPRELEEAALVDGCSRLSAFWRVALPVAAPGLVATALLCFIFAWNEFMFALFLMREIRTLPVLIPCLIGGHEILWGAISAMGLLSIIPPVLIAVLLQKYVIRGMTFGAIKG